MPLPRVVKHHDELKPLGLDDSEAVIRQQCLKSAQSNFDGVATFLVRLANTKSLQVCMEQSTVTMYDLQILTPLEANLIHSLSFPSRISGFRPILLSQPRPSEPSTSRTDDDDDVEGFPLELISIVGCF